MIVLLLVAVLVEAFLIWTLILVQGRQALRLYDLEQRIRQPLTQGGVIHGAVSDKDA